METIKTVNDEKKALRQIIKAKKKELTTDDVRRKTESILSQLMIDEEYVNAKRIYTYVNYNQEVDTCMLIERAILDGKIVLVPRVDGDFMEFYQIESLEQLAPGAYGILEPVADCKMDTKHDGVMIMPGLAFDRKLHRIGYGGGFYDRYLQEYQEFYKIALCFDFQIVDEVPAQEFDIPVDCVISETMKFITNR